MKKIIIFGIILLLLLLTGCPNKCDECCIDCFSNYPNPNNIYVTCNNQQIWDMRGSLEEFNCQCVGGYCNIFPTKRVCNYGLWVKINNTIVYEEGEIICTEIIGKDRRCD